VHSFGKGFEWHDDCYLNFAGSAGILEPVATAYGISRAVVPDFRAFNGRVHDTRDSTMISISNALPMSKTAAPVDGVIVTDTSVFAITKDCPVTVLAFKGKKTAVVLHCARDALGSSSQESVINQACRRLAPFDTSDVIGFICNGIGVDNFDHPSESDQPIIDHFASTCGKHVVKHAERGCLNLPAIIQAQLRPWGITNVSWDAVDTYADNRFNSRRRGSKFSNCALVNMERAFGR
jgi:copper oxidase (laccase) domain-containing protein